MRPIPVTSRNGQLQIAVACTALLTSALAVAGDDLDLRVQAALRNAGLTGTIQAQLVPRLGRPLNPALANLGRLLWFDKLGGLHDDNTCGGCHSPSRGFGDTQSIAIGIQNNNVVGPHRAGPRNQRRTPFASNTPFYPNMMWNGRFAAISGNPFDNSQGFRFPFPEGTTRFAANDPVVTHLSIAQAHMPPTELVEVAGFTCTAGTIAPVWKHSITSCCGTGRRSTRSSRVITCREWTGDGYAHSGASRRSRVLRGV